MRLRLLLTLTLTLCWTGARAGSFIRLNDNVQLPLPLGWTPTSDSLKLPFQLVNTDTTAEILVFQSDIEGDQMITDEQSLKLSVDEVIAGVIMTLPDGRLMTSTGYNEKYRTSFALDFTSTDSASGNPIRHRLVGILYRISSDHQKLFTVWGRSELDLYLFEEPSIRMVQDGFNFTGEHQPDVFGSTTRTWWILALVIVFTVAVFLFFRPGSRRLAILPLNLNSTAWRCECGRRNYEENGKCRRCGRLRHDR